MAKREAGQIESSRPNSHDLICREGEYLYPDTCLGGERFAGEEAVWGSENPAYAMNFCWQVLDDRCSGGFLKAALQRVPEDRLFHGPERFQSHEEIRRQDAGVYECCFHGGTVR